MSYNHRAQQSTNREAVADPKPGDYWHEMFCPYFLVVAVADQKITVLNCLASRGVSARIPVDADHWTFDYNKSIVVDRHWIDNLVKYESSNDYVADVVRDNEKYQTIVDEWVAHRAAQLMQEFQALGPAATKYLLDH